MFSIYILKKKKKLHIIVGEVGIEGMGRLVMMMILVWLVNVVAEAEDSSLSSLPSLKSPLTSLPLIAPPPFHLPPASQDDFLSKSRDCRKYCSKRTFLERLQASWQRRKVILLQKKAGYIYILKM